MSESFHSEEFLYISLNHLDYRILLLSSRNPHCEFRNPLKVGKTLNSIGVTGHATYSPFPANHRESPANFHNRLDPRSRVSVRPAIRYPVAD